MTYRRIIRYHRSAEGREKELSARTWLKDNMPEGSYQWTKLSLEEYVLELGRPKRMDDIVADMAFHLILAIFDDIENYILFAMRKSL